MSILPRFIFYQDFFFREETTFIMIAHSIRLRKSSHPG